MNKTKIIACRTLAEEVLAVLPAGLDYEFLEYGLHNTPDKLRQQLQQSLDQSPAYTTLLFGYGLCSNGVIDLKAPQQTLVIPRVHDCISLLLGARSRYDEEFARYPATYYLSRGWIEQKGDPLSSFYRYCERYGEKNARWVIQEEYKNYQRLVYIHTLGDDEADIAYSRQVAEFLQVDFVEMAGSLRYFQKLVNGNWDEDFLVVPPGESAAVFSFL